MDKDCCVLMSTLVRWLVLSKIVSKQELPTQVARVDAPPWLPANTRAAACARLKVPPLKNVSLGMTVTLPLRTMLVEGAR